MSKSVQYPFLFFFSFFTTLGSTGAFLPAHFENPHPFGVPFSIPALRPVNYSCCKHVWELYPMYRKVISYVLISCLKHRVKPSVSLYLSPHSVSVL